MKKTTLPDSRIHLAGEAESLAARVDAVHRAIWRRNDMEDGPNWEPMDILTDAVVVRAGRMLLWVPYGFNDQGEVRFDEPKNIDEVSAGEAEAVEFGALLVAQSTEGDAAGWEWEVTIIEPGLSKNDWYFTPETLAAAVEAGHFEGRPVYAFPETGLTHHNDVRKKDARKLIGWTTDVRMADDGRVVARMHFLETTFADQYRTALVEAWRRGVTDLFGLSIHATVLAAPVQIQGRLAKYAIEFREVLSTELVARPAAGGKFTHLVAALAADTEETEMDPKARLIALLLALGVESVAEKDPEKCTIDELLAAVPEKLPTPKKPAATTPQAAPDDGHAQLQAALSEVKALATGLRAQAMVAESQLPEPAQARLRERFEGVTATQEEIQQAIDAEREYLTKLHPARVEGAGFSRPSTGVVVVGAEKLDRLQAGLDRAFGLEPENADLRNVPPIGLRRFYDEITMGHDPDVSGSLSPQAQQEMAREAFDSTTLPRSLANTMGRRLTRDYRAVDYGEGRIISMRGSAENFKTIEAIRIGYFGDIGTVDPESGAYSEITAYGEEASTFSVGQRGVKVTLTRKHIINDDVGAVAKITGRLGRAARRTHARFVWGFVVNNSTLTMDATAWFHASHNNLQTGALAVAELNAAELKLFNQAEPDSDEKLGLMPVLLVVPGELKSTAIAINQSQLIPGSTNNDANPWYHRFGANNEGILVSPLFTDANDWALFADPADVDMVEMAYLNGRQEPELFLQDQPTVGSVFTQDQITYKIRHEYGGTPVDYRGAVKAVVA